MLDRVIGLCALAVLLGFFGILVVFVPDPELMMVIGVVAAMAIYEFYITLFRGGTGSGG